MKTKLFLHAWAIQKKDNEYFLPYTHWVYLREIVTYFDKIIVVSGCQKLSDDISTSAVSINVFSNVSVYELPMSNGYVGAIKHFFSYYKAYRSIKNVTTYYSRYPVPFGWLQKVVGKNRNRIIHYVGDPVDAAINNPNFSKTKKRILINAFKPENALYDWACKGAKVFTNGYHIADKLGEKNIQATPLISSTLIEEDFYFEEDKQVNFEELRFIYLGYLRKAKGVETVINAFGKFQVEHPKSSLTIIGTGEFEDELKKIVSYNQYRNITFKGHIDDRDQINQLLREHDVFLFASLSEGSPRVILEAMANGLAVISTPVGSLPKVFEDNKEILFAGFNNIEDFIEKMDQLANKPNLYIRIRKNSFEKVKVFTIKNFIKKIFNDT